MPKLNKPATMQSLLERRAKLLGPNVPILTIPPLPLKHCAYLTLGWPMAR
jgi:hypothetical protein